MRARARLGALVSAAGLLAAACVTPSPPAPRVEVLGAAGAATRFGRTGPEVVAHAQVGPSLPALFGRDWAPDGSPVATTRPARDFLGRAGAPRALRVGDREYVAVTGCVPGACRSHRALLLVAADGGELRARLEEPGLRHHYAFGPGARMDEPDRRAVDTAWRVLEADAAAWPSDP
jgi:hypothetical protein